MAIKPGTKRRSNILIIEDFPSWQKNFKRFLRNEPFNLLFAGNRREALRLIRTYVIDLLILDINLSGVPYNVDGLRIADLASRWQRNMKVIIVSGSREWDQRLRTCRFDPTFIIDKQSLEQDDFIAKVYQSLGYYRSLNQ